MSGILFGVVTGDKLEAIASDLVTELNREQYKC